MADDEYPSRRRQDGKLDAIMEAQRDHMDKHVEEYHAFKKDSLLAMVKEHEVLVEDMEKGNHKLDIIVDLLAGEPKIDSLTGDIVRAPGIAHRVEVLEDKANGGGGVSAKMTWTTTLKVSIITSLITAGSLIIAALLSGSDQI